MRNQDVRLTPRQQLIEVTRSALHFAMCPGGAIGAKIFSNASGDGDIAGYVIGTLMTLPAAMVTFVTIGPVSAAFDRRFPQPEGYRR